MRGGGAAGHPAAIHAARVHRECDVALAVHGDHAAVAANVADVGDRGRSGRLHGIAMPGDAIAELACGAGADEELAGTGGGNGAGSIRGIGARADHGRVADASPAFAGHAAGGRTRGHVAVNVEGHRAHGAARVRGIEQLRVVAAPVEQLLPALLGAEVARIDLRQTLLHRKLVGAFARQHDVAAISP